jgi:hypothetical protein
MAYPISGADYKHNPKFIDRMKEGEDKTITPYKQSDFDPVEPLVSSAMQAALRKIETSKEDN